MSAPRGRRNRHEVAAAFLGRLRRLEVLVMYLSGVRKLTQVEVDNLLAALYHANDVEEPEAGRGRPDYGEVVHSQGREAGAHVRGASGREHRDEEDWPVGDAPEEEEPED